MILMRLLVFITFLFQIDVTSAQDLYAKENRFLAFVYQQKEYRQEDPQGDFLLLWSVSQIPHFVVSGLKGETDKLLRERKEKIEELLQKYPDFRPVPESQNVIVEDYIPYRTDHHPVALEGHKAPFKVKNVALMLEQVIVEEFQNNGIEPVLGKPHKWSKEGKSKGKKFLFKIGQLSKLLVALSRGVTSQYMISGTEHELKEYLIAQETESVTLESMFRASYRINQGDVYKSLLTIENVLSQFWLSSQREKRLITTKLKDITNYYYRTDKFGAWYHLFGVMLYGYAEGGLKARAIGRIEALGSGVLSGFKDEKQETYINLNGGRIGGKLKRFIKKKNYLKFESNPDYLKEAFYLQLDEDFSERLSKMIKTTEAVH